MILPPPHAVRDVQLLKTAKLIRRLRVPYSNSQAHSFLSVSQGADHCIMVYAVRCGEFYEIELLSKNLLRQGDLLFLPMGQHPSVLKINYIIVGEQNKGARGRIVYEAKGVAFPDCLGSLDAEEAQWWSDVLDSIKWVFEGQVVLSRHGSNLANEAFLQAQEDFVI